MLVHWENTILMPCRSKINKLILSLSLWMAMQPFQYKRNCTKTDWIWWNEKPHKRERDANLCFNEPLGCKKWAKLLKEKREENYAEHFRPWGRELIANLVLLLATRFQGVGEIAYSGMFANASKIFWRTSKIFWNCKHPTSLPISNNEK